MEFVTDTVEPVPLMADPTGVQPLVRLLLEYSV